MALLLFSEGAMGFAADYCVSPLTVKTVRQFFFRGWAGVLSLPHPKSSLILAVPIVKSTECGGLCIMANLYL